MCKITSASKDTNYYIVFVPFSLRMKGGRPIDVASRGIPGDASVGKDGEGERQARSVTIKTRRSSFPFVEPKKKLYHTYMILVWNRASRISNLMAAWLVWKREGN